MKLRSMFGLAIACAACGKDAGTTKSAPPAPVQAPPPVQPDAAPPDAAPPKLVLPWSTDTTASIAKLQGAWVVKGFGSYGSVSAWRFDGAKVTVYDPSKHTETPDVLLFNSPCAVRLDSGNGGTLVIDGDTVYLGLGGGGLKQGDTVIACMGSGTVYRTAAGCATYHEEFGKWTMIETTCALPEGRFVATEKSDRGESSLRFWNEHLLLTDQLADNKLVKYPDWASAKAAADKAAKGK